MSERRREIDSQIKDLRTRERQLAGLQEQEKKLKKQFDSATDEKMIIELGKRLTALAKKIDKFEADIERQRRQIARD